MVASLVLDIAVEAVGTLGDTTVVTQICEEARGTEGDTGAIDSLSCGEVGVLVHGRSALGDTLLGGVVVVGELDG